MKKIEAYRKSIHPFISKKGDNFGLFYIPFKKVTLKVLCSPLGKGEWDHVSVSTHFRCPTWEEMNFIKDLFFSENDTVVQFHPKKSEYVNNHKYCLHLWKHKEGHELPPSFLVGIK